MFAVLPFVVISTLVTAIIYLPWSQPSRRGLANDGRDYVVSIRNEKGVDERAFKVSLAEAGTWTYERDIIDDFRLRDDSDNVDEQIVREGGVDLALRHREKDVWIAFAAKDYGMQLLYGRDALSGVAAVEEVSANRSKQPPRWSRLPWPGSRASACASRARTAT